MVASLLPLLLFTPFLQQPVQVAERVEVDAQGAHLIREYRTNAGASWIDNASGGSTRVVNTARWEETDGGLAWIARTIAVGDNGASLMAGKELNNESVTLYPTGTSQNIFDFAAPGAESPPVAIAARAPVAAALIVTDINPDPGIIDYQGVLNVFDTAGSGTPDWSFTFPTTLNFFGGGVAISDDGSVILAWKANPNTSTALVEAFDRNGTSIASGSVASGTSFHIRQGRMSADGSRAYFNIGADAIIWNVATATVEFVHSIGASFDSHALSHDGSRFAYGNFGLFAVWEEISPGNWAQIASKFFAGGTYVGRLDLNADGTRLGYMVQRFSPASDHIEIALFDVDAGADLFSASYDAPGTAFQLIASGCRVDENGEDGAGISRGDSCTPPPEAFAYDDAGNLTAEIDTSGSAFGIDLDGDGDVLGVGTKAVHANTFGNGGSVLAVDAFDQLLHIEGYPQLGGTVNLTVPGGVASAGFSACRALGSSPSQWGVTELDLATQLTILGPYPVPVGGLVQPEVIPNAAFLLGTAVHVQGVWGSGATAQLTNKVSLRILP